MVDVALWFVGILLTAAFSVLVHVTPALFHVCIFFERLIFALVQRTTSRLVSIGELTLVSGFVWGMGGALIGMVFLSGVVGAATGALALGSMGVVWGLSVGYQAAVQEVAHTLRRPGSLEHHRPGSLSSGTDEVVQASPDFSTRDDSWLEGIFLGEAQEQRRRR